MLMRGNTAHAFAAGRCLPEQGMRSWGACRKKCDASDSQACSCRTTLAAAERSALTWCCAPHSHGWCSGQQAQAGGLGSAAGGGGAQAGGAVGVPDWNGPWIACMDVTR